MRKDISNQLGEEYSGTRIAQAFIDQGETGTIIQVNYTPEQRKFNAAIGEYIRNVEKAHKATDKSQRILFSQRDLELKKAREEYQKTA